MPNASNAATPLGLGRMPRQAQVLDHMAKREQGVRRAHLGRGDPAHPAVLTRHSLPVGQPQLRLRLRCGACCIRTALVQNLGRAGTRPRSVCTTACTSFGVSMAAMPWPTARRKQPSERPRQPHIPRQNPQHLVLGGRWRNSGGEARRVSAGRQLLLGAGDGRGAGGQPRPQRAVRGNPTTLTPGYLIASSRPPL